MVQFLHISPREFLHDSFRLGKAVYDSGFRPKHVISIWRGGTPVGLGVDAYFRTRGIFLNHTTIATESYMGIQEQAEVTVKGLEHLIDVVCCEDGLLIVDDVLESGRTIQRILEILKDRARANMPEDIRVATVHRKPDRCLIKNLKVVCLKDLPSDIWIDYPHELSDLVDENDPEDLLIKEKSPDIWQLLRDGPGPIEEVAGPNGVFAPTSEQLLLDSLDLGLRLFADESFRPDFLIALWPGGVSTGLPVHELYKYYAKKGRIAKAPDHISLNTVATRMSYHSDIIGSRYLVEHINPQDRLLLIDTTFRSGQLVNNALMRLKEALRRNLSLDLVRIAAVYYNPEDSATWTVPRVATKPHYYSRVVRQEVIYPHSVPKLHQPRKQLKSQDPVLHQILYGADDAP